MQYTDRLKLKKPDQDDAYQVDDFNENYQKISEAFAGVPVKTEGIKTIEEYIATDEASAMKKGDTVFIDNVIYILIGDNPLIASNWKPYGAEAFILMKNGGYVPISERIKQSIYLQVGTARRVIVRVFKEFFKNLFQTTAVTSVSNGIAYSVIKDKVTVSGTASADSEISLGTMTMKANDSYSLKGCASGGSESTYMIELRDSSSNVLATDYGEGTTYTPSSDVQVELFIKVLSGFSTTALVFDPRIQVIDGCSLGNEFTLFVHETEEKTEKVDDGNIYQFTCKNMSIIGTDDTSERIRGKIYFSGSTEE